MANGLIIPDQYSPTHLTLPGGLNYEEWEQIGRKIQMAANASMWWLGDWWAYGEHRYGERAAQAVDSNYSFQTFANAASVARKIETYRRRELLSFSHHAEVAPLDPDKQDELLDKAEKENWTRRDLRKAVRDHKRGEKKSQPLPEGKYSIIYADPPWKYSDERNLDGYDTNAASNTYPTMTLDELCALPAGKLAHKDTVLFLWSTAPLLKDALRVMEAWGFEYKTNMVWDKINPGMGGLGHYHNTNHEQLLIGVKGSYLPDGEKFDSVQSIKKSGRHSEKPEEWREIIDTMYPKGDRIELFRRGDKPTGWTVWGQEVELLENIM